LIVGINFLPVVDTLEVRLFAFLGAMLKPVLPDS